MTSDKLEDEERTGARLIERDGIKFEAYCGPTSAVVVGPLPSSLPAEDLEHAEPEADHE